MSDSRKSKLTPGDKNINRYIELRGVEQAQTAVGGIAWVIWPQEFVAKLEEADEAHSPYTGARERESWRRENASGDGARPLAPFSFSA